MPAALTLTTLLSVTAGASSVAARATAGTVTTPHVIAAATTRRRNRCCLVGLLLIGGVRDNVMRAASARDAAPRSPDGHIRMTRRVSPWLLDGRGARLSRGGRARWRCGRRSGRERVEPGAHREHVPVVGADHPLADLALAAEQPLVDERAEEPEAVDVARAVDDEPGARWRTPAPSDGSGGSARSGDPSRSRASEMRGRRSRACRRVAGARVSSDNAPTSSAMCSMTLMA